MANEIMVVPEVKELTIPTENLNKDQRREYKEWATNALRDIENKVDVILDRKQKEFDRENTERLKEQILKKNKALKPKMEAYMKLLAEATALGEESKEEFDKFEKAYESLRESREQKEIAYKIKAREVIKKMGALKELNSEEIKVDFVNKPKGDTHTIRSNSFPCWEIVRVFNVPFELYDQNNKVRTNVDEVLKSLIDSEVIAEGLSKEFKKQWATDFKVKEQIRDMRERVEEAILFDGSILKPVFKELFKIRSAIKEKYREVMIKE